MNKKQADIQTDKLLLIQLRTNSCYAEISVHSLRPKVLM